MASIEVTDQRRMPFHQIDNQLADDVRVGPYEYAVYGQLVRHRNQGTGACHPGMKRMAANAGMSERRVRDAVKSLKAMGYIGVAETAGKVHHYALLDPPALPATPAPPAGVDEDAPRQEVPHPPAGDAGVPRQEVPDTPAGGAAEQDEVTRRTEKDEGITRALTLVTESVEASIDSRFDRFWQRYPKRDGKRIGRAKARARFAKLAERDMQPLWRGVCNYADACENHDWRAKDAERWLRDRCWDDWQEPVEASATNGRRPSMRQDLEATAQIIAEAPEGGYFGGLGTDGL